MSKTYSLDVIKEITDLLTNNLSTTIQTINTTRTLTTPLPLSITSTYFTNQFPVVFIDIVDTSIFQEEICKDPETSVEVFNVEITAYLKSSEPDLYKWIEVYLEAMYKVLQNYSSDKLTWLAITGTARDTVQTDERQTLKFATVKCSVRTN